MTIAANPRRYLVQRHDSAAERHGGEPDWLACGHLLRPADEAEIAAHLDWIAERAALLRTCPAVRAAGLEPTCSLIERRVREAKQLLRGEVNDAI